MVLIKMGSGYRSLGVFNKAWYYVLKSPSVINRNADRGGTGNELGLEPRARVGPGRNHSTRWAGASKPASFKSQGRICGQTLQVWAHCVHSLRDYWRLVPGHRKPRGSSKSCPDVLSLSAPLRSASWEKEDECVATWKNLKTKKVKRIQVEEKAKQEFKKKIISL